MSGMTYCSSRKVSATSHHVRVHFSKDKRFRKLGTKPKPNCETESDWTKPSTKYVNLVTMLFCAILAATPTDFDQAIRYEARGKDVTRIVADLAQMSGKKLETEGLEDWPLIVRIEKRPLSQVMDLIAAKTDSVWMQKDDRQILTRTKARREEALKREARHRGERMKKWLSSNFGLEGATRPWTDQEIETIVAQNKKIVEAKATGYLKMVKPDQVGIASTVTPAKILLQEFCRRISPETLGGLPIDSHLSFSTSPKAPEKPLPVNLGQALRSYITTRAAFAAKLPAEPPNLDGVIINSNDRQSLTPLDPNFVIRFELIRVGTETNVHAGVVVHGADRRTLLDTYGLEIQLDPLPVVPPPENLKGIVEYKPDSAAILQYMGKNRPVLGQAQGAKRRILRIRCRDSPPSARHTR